MISRIFFLVFDNLLKARQKCKKAERESELATDQEDGRKRKKKTVYESDESDGEKENEKYIKINYPKPPDNNALVITLTDAFKTLLPEQNKLYTYALKANISTGTLTPIKDSTFWILEGALSVQVYDEYGRARFLLEGLKTTVSTKHGVSHHQTEAVKHLQGPWEVDACFSSIHADTGPEWATNLKRGLTFNFLVAEPLGKLSSIEEPCLYGNCYAIYTRSGVHLRKYYALMTRRNAPTVYEQRCNPPKPNEWRRVGERGEDPNYIVTAERDYYLDERIGLQKMALKSEIQYRTRDHILSVTTDLSLNYESSEPAQSIRKLNLTELPIQYNYHNFTNPSNGIWNVTQNDLKNKTYGILLKIARKGIDADNIVRNASLIHSLDFIKLMTSTSQLNYESLKRLFYDVLGTSYELETAKNIFLEVLPYVRNDAGAKLIRFLVTEQKEKIEDAMLVSLIRKLPYNILNLNKNLLQDLEVLSKLPPEYPRDIRHAGILSFATLVSKTMEVAFDQEYFDDIYDKYLRMYNYSPQYRERLVWLQGLTNIGKAGVNYLDEIYIDGRKDRHDRIWAAMASLSIWRSASLENALPILQNETEHDQLRIIALHALFSSALSSKDLFNIYSYVESCKSETLKKFWWSTVKSMKNNRFYGPYKAVSNNIPYLSAKLSSPKAQQWATNNYIVSQEPGVDGHGGSFQLMTVGGRWSGPPELVIVEFSTGGQINYNAAIYIIAEGVTTNVFKRLQTFDTSEKFTDDLMTIMKNLNVKILEPEKVHIDIIIKINDKTVYANHINQEMFDSWNTEELTKCIEDFVRFGSHINQQIVYYPVQMLKDIPTEIGTPVRLQSVLVSFTSLRGNLTAPSTTEDLTWRNDFHIRYQGTSLTSLSTDGPLQPSDHTARIQQSIVMHLPIKFDIQLSPVNRSLEIKWTNPAQNGGIAMHSRTQLSTKYRGGRDVHTVSNKHKGNKEQGIFFDCENPMSNSEISQHLNHYKTLITSLQPSHIILNTIHLITSPTSGSCGVILPPTQLETGSKFDIQMKVDEFNWDGDGLTIGLSFGISYYRAKENASKTDYFSLNGFSKVSTDGKNGDLKAGLSFIDVYSALHKKSLNLCIQNHHISLSPFNIDFTNDPQSSKGELKLFSAHNEPFECFTDENITSDLKILYENRLSGGDERDFALLVTGRMIPKLNYQGLDFFGHHDVIAFLNSMVDDSGYEFNNEAVITQKHGESTVTINGRPAPDYKLNSLSWIPSSLSAVQALKQIGFYHECRVKSNRENSEDELLIGDCTDKPRFAIIQPNYNNGKIILYTGRESLAYYSDRGFAPSNGTDQLNIDFKITSKDNEYILRSKMTGVLVYYQPNNEVVILVPQPYMYTACGLCIEQLSNE